MKNNGFSRFLKVSWEISVSISTTPQALCAGLAPARGDPVLLVRAHEVAMFLAQGDLGGIAVILAKFIGVSVLETPKRQLETPFRRRETPKRQRFGARNAV